MFELELQQLKEFLTKNLISKELTNIILSHLANEYASEELDPKKYNEEKAQYTKFLREEFLPSLIKYNQKPDQKHFDKIRRDDPNELKLFDKIISATDLNLTVIKEEKPLSLKLNESLPQYKVYKQYGDKSFGSRYVVAPSEEVVKRKSSALVKHIINIDNVKSDPDVDTKILFGLIIEGASLTQIVEDPQGRRTTALHELIKRSMFSEITVLLPYHTFEYEGVPKQEFTRPFNLDQKNKDGRNVIDEIIVQLEKPGLPKDSYNELTRLLIKLLAESHKSKNTDGKPFDLTRYKWVFDKFGDYNKLMVYAEAEGLGKKLDKLEILKPNTVKLYELVNTLNSTKEFDLPKLIKELLIDPAEKGGKSSKADILLNELLDPQKRILYKNLDTNYVEQLLSYYAKAEKYVDMSTTAFGDVGHTYAEEANAKFILFSNKYYSREALPQNPLSLQVGNRERVNFEKASKHWSKMLCIAIKEGNLGLFNYITEIIANGKPNIKIDYNYHYVTFDKKGNISYATIPLNLAIPDFGDDYVNPSIVNNIADIKRQMFDKLLTLGAKPHHHYIDKLSSGTRGADGSSSSELIHNTIDHAAWVDQFYFYEKISEYYKNAGLFDLAATPHTYSALELTRRNLAEDNPDRAKYDQALNELLEFKTSIGDRQDLLEILKRAASEVNICRKFEFEDEAKANIKLENALREFDNVLRQFDPKNTPSIASPDGVNTFTVEEMDYLMQNFRIDFNIDDDAYLFYRLQQFKFSDGSGIKLPIGIRHENIYPTPEFLLNQSLETVYLGELILAEAGKGAEGFKGKSLINISELLNAGAYLNGEVYNIPKPKDYFISIASQIQNQSANDRRLSTEATSIENAKKLVRTADLKANISELMLGFVVNPPYVDQRNQPIDYSNRGELFVSDMLRYIESAPIFEPQDYFEIRKIVFDEIRKNKGTITLIDLARQQQNPALKELVDFYDKNVPGRFDLEKRLTGNSPIINSLEGQSRLDKEVYTRDYIDEKTNKGGRIADYWLYLELDNLNNPDELKIFLEANKVPPFFDVNGDNYGLYQLIPKGKLALFTPVIDDYIDSYCIRMADNIIDVVALQTTFTGEIYSKNQETLFKAAVDEIISAGVTEQNTDALEIFLQRGVSPNNDKYAGIITLAKKGYTASLKVILNDAAHPEAVLSEDGRLIILNQTIRNIYASPEAYREQLTIALDGCFNNADINKLGAIEKNQQYQTVITEVAKEIRSLHERVMSSPSDPDIAQKLENVKLVEGYLRDYCETPIFKDLPAGARYEMLESIAPDKQLLREFYVEEYNEQGYLKADRSKALANATARLKAVKQVLSRLNETYDLGIDNIDQASYDDLKNVALATAESEEIIIRTHRPDYRGDAPEPVRVDVATAAPEISEENVIRILVIDDSEMHKYEDFARRLEIDTGKKVELKQFSNLIDADDFFSKSWNKKADIIISDHNASYSIEYNNIAGDEYPFAIATEGKTVVEHFASQNTNEKSLYYIASYNGSDPVKDVATLAADTKLNLKDRVFYANPEEFLVVNGTFSDKEHDIKALPSFKLSESLNGQYGTNYPTDYAGAVKHKNNIKNPPPKPIRILVCESTDINPFIEQLRKSTTVPFEIEFFQSEYSNYNSMLEQSELAKAKLAEWNKTGGADIIIGPDQKPLEALAAMNANKKAKYAFSGDDTDRGYFDLSEFGKQQNVVSIDPNDFVWLGRPELLDNSILYAYPENKLAKLFNPVFGTNFPENISQVWEQRYTFSEPENVTITNPIGRAINVLIVDDNYGNYDYRLQELLETRYGKGVTFNFKSAADITEAKAHVIEFNRAGGADVIITDHYYHGEGIRSGDVVKQLFEGNDNKECLYVVHSDVGNDFYNPNAGLGVASAKQIKIDNPKINVIGCAPWEIAANPAHFDVEKSRFVNALDKRLGLMINEPTPPVISPLPEGSAEPRTIRVVIGDDVKGEAYRNFFYELQQRTPWLKFEIATFTNFAGVEEQVKKWGGAEIVLLDENFPAAADNSPPLPVTETFARISQINSNPNCSYGSITDDVFMYSSLFRQGETIGRDLNVFHYTLDKHLPADLAVMSGNKPLTQTFFANLVDPKTDIVFDRPMEPLPRIEGKPTIKVLVIDDSIDNSQAREFALRLQDRYGVNIELNLARNKTDAQAKLAAMDNNADLIISTEFLSPAARQVIDYTKGQYADNYTGIDVIDALNQQNGNKSCGYFLDTPKSNAELAPVVARKLAAGYIKPETVGIIKISDGIQKPNRHTFTGDNADPAIQFLNEKLNPQEAKKKYTVVIFDEDSAKYVEQIRNYLGPKYNAAGVELEIVAAKTVTEFKSYFKNNPAGANLVISDYHEGVGTLMIASAYYYNQNPDCEYIIATQGGALTVSDVNKGIAVNYGLEVKDKGPRDGKPETIDRSDVEKVFNLQTKDIKHLALESEKNFLFEKIPARTEAGVTEIPKKKYTVVLFDLDNAKYIHQIKNYLGPKFTAAGIDLDIVTPSSLDDLNKYIQANPKTVDLVVSDYLNTNDRGDIILANAFYYNQNPECEYILVSNDNPTPTFVRDVVADKYEELVDLNSVPEGKPTDATDFFDYWSDKISSRHISNIERPEEYNLILESAEKKFGALPKVGLSETYDILLIDEDAAMYVDKLRATLAERYGAAGAKINIVTAENLEDAKVKLSGFPNGADMIISDQKFNKVDASGSNNLVELAFINREKKPNCEYVLAPYDPEDHLSTVQRMHEIYNQAYGKKENMKITLTSSQHLRGKVPGIENSFFRIIENRYGLTPAPTVESKTYHILLVDEDGSAYIDKLRAALEARYGKVGAKFNIGIARSGREALAILDGTDAKIDMIISDYNFLEADTNGAKVLSELARINQPRNPDCAYILGAYDNNMLRDGPILIQRNYNQNGGVGKINITSVHTKDLNDPVANGIAPAIESNAVFQVFENIYGENLKGEVLQAAANDNDPKINLVDPNQVEEVLADPTNVQKAKRFITSFAPEDIKKVLNPVITDDITGLPKEDFTVTNGKSVSGEVIAVEFREVAESGTPQDKLESTKQFESYKRDIIKQIKDIKEWNKANPTEEPRKIILVFENYSPSYADLLKYADGVVVIDGKSGAGTAHLKGILDNYPNLAFVSETTASNFTYSDLSYKDPSQLAALSISVAEDELRVAENRSLHRQACREEFNRYANGVVNSLTIDGENVVIYPNIALKISDVSFTSQRLADDIYGKGVIPTGQVETANKRFFDALVTSANLIGAEYEAPYLYLNIDKPSQLDFFLDGDVSLFKAVRGVGLVRTEHMMLSKEEKLNAFVDFVSAENDKTAAIELAKIEKQQTETFTKIYKRGELFEAEKGSFPIIIRLLDAPIDEFITDPAQKAQFIKNYTERANTLGIPVPEFKDVRGALFSTLYPEFYEMQIRAQLNAVSKTNFSGSINIQIPLVRTVPEIEAFQKMVFDIVAKEHPELAFRVRTGIMAETLDILAKGNEVPKGIKFIGDGTNDGSSEVHGYLRNDFEAQKQVANDSNYGTPPTITMTDDVNQKYLDFHKALRAANPDVVIGACGIHASDPTSVQKFLGYRKIRGGDVVEGHGLDYLSVQANQENVYSTVTAIAQSAIAAKEAGIGRATEPVLRKQDIEGILSLPADKITAEKVMEGLSFYNKRIASLILSNKIPASVKVAMEEDAFINKINKKNPELLADASEESLIAKILASNDPLMINMYLTSLHHSGLIDEKHHTLILKKYQSVSSSTSPTTDEIHVYAVIAEFYRDSGTTYSEVVARTLKELTNITREQQGLPPVDTDSPDAKSAEMETAKPSGTAEDGKPLRQPRYVSQQDISFSLNGYILTNPPHNQYLNDKPTMLEGHYLVRPGQVVTTADPEAKLVSTPHNGPVIYARDKATGTQVLTQIDTIALSAFLNRMYESHSNMTVKDAKNYIVFFIKNQVDAVKTQFDPATIANVEFFVSLNPVIEASYSDQTAVAELKKNSGEIGSLETLLNLTQQDPALVKKLGISNNCKVERTYNGKYRLYSLDAENGYATEPLAELNGEGKKPLQTDDGARFYAAALQNWADDINSVFQRIEIAKSTNQVRTDVYDFRKPEESAKIKQGWDNHFEGSAKVNEELATPKREIYTTDKILKEVKGYLKGYKNAKIYSVVHNEYVDAAGKTNHHAVVTLYDENGNIIPTERRVFAVEDYKTSENLLDRIQKDNSFDNIKERNPQSSAASAKFGRVRIDKWDYLRVETNVSNFGKVTGKVSLYNQLVMVADNLQKAEEAESRGYTAEAEQYRAQAQHGAVFFAGMYAAGIGAEYIQFDRRVSNLIMQAADSYTIRYGEKAAAPFLKLAARTQMSPFIGNIPAFEYITLPAIYIPAINMAATGKEKAVLTGQMVGNLTIATIAVKYVGRSNPITIAFTELGNAVYYEAFKDDGAMPSMLHLGGTMIVEGLVNLNYQAIQNRVVWGTSVFENTPEILRYGFVKPDTKSKDGKPEIYEIPVINFRTARALSYIDDKYEVELSGETKAFMDKYIADYEVKKEQTRKEMEESGLSFRTKEDETIDKIYNPEYGNPEAPINKSIAVYFAYRDLKGKTDEASIEIRKDLFDLLSKPLFLGTPKFDSVISYDSQINALQNVDRAKVSELPKNTYEKLPECLRGEAYSVFHITQANGQDKKALKTAEEFRRYTERSETALATGERVAIAVNLFNKNSEDFKKTLKAAGITDFSDKKIPTFESSVSEERLNKLLTPEMMALGYDDFEKRGLPKEAFDALTFTEKKAVIRQRITMDYFEPFCHDPKTGYLHERYLEEKAAWENPTPTDPEGDKFDTNYWMDTKQRRLEEYQSLLTDPNVIKYYKELEDFTRDLDAKKLEEITSRINIPSEIYVKCATVSGVHQSLLDELATLKKNQGYFQKEYGIPPIDCDAKKAELEEKYKKYRDFVEKGYFKDGKDGIAEGDKRFDILTQEQLMEFRDIFDEFSQYTADLSYEINKRYERLAEDGKFRQDIENEKQPPQVGKGEGGGTGASVLNRILVRDRPERKITEPDIKFLEGLRAKSIKTDKCSDYLIYHLKLGEFKDNFVRPEGNPDEYIDKFDKSLNEVLKMTETKIIDSIFFGGGVEDYQQIRDVIRQMGDNKLINQTQKDNFERLFSRYDGLFNGMNDNKRKDKMLILDDNGKSLDDGSYGFINLPEDHERMNNSSWAAFNEYESAIASGISKSQANANARMIIRGDALAIREGLVDTRNIFSDANELVEGLYTADGDDIPDFQQVRRNEGLKLENVFADGVDTKTALANIGKALTAQNQKYDKVTIDLTSLQAERYDLNTEETQISAAIKALADSGAVMKFDSKDKNTLEAATSAILAENLSQLGEYQLAQYYRDAMDGKVKTSSADIEKFENKFSSNGEKFTVALRNLSLAMGDAKNNIYNHVNPEVDDNINSVVAAYTKLYKAYGDLVAENSGVNINLTGGSINEDILELRKLVSTRLSEMLLPNKDRDLAESQVLFGSTFFDQRLAKIEEKIGTPEALDNSITVSDLITYVDRGRGK